MTRHSGYAGRKVSVVAVMKPDQWVIRAISDAYGSPTRMVEALQSWVGRLDPELVWTGYTYEGPPWYLSVPYFMGDKAIRIQHGIWMFPIERTYPERNYPSKYGPDPGDVVLGPATRLGDIFG